MAVKVSKDQMSLRPRSKVLPIVVNADDRSLGTVAVTVCEIPAGLFEELEGEAKDFAEEIREKNRLIATRRRRIFALEDLFATRTLSDGSPKSDPAQVAADIAAELEATRLLKEQRKALRESLHRIQIELIAWGVCNHQAEDFLDGEEAQAFEATAGTYDGINYRIAGPNTVLQYASVGRFFVDSLYLAVTNYQRQIIIDPKTVWEQAEKTKKLLEAAFERIMKEQVDQAVKVATGETKEDQAAELGAELGEDDPNAKRSPATATPAA